MIWLSEGGKRNKSLRKMTEEKNYHHDVNNYQKLHSQGTHNNYFSKKQIIFKYVREILTKYYAEWPANLVIYGE